MTASCKRDRFWVERDPLIVEMWNAGERTAAIARACGVQDATITKRRRELGLHPRPVGNQAGRPAGHIPCRVDPCRVDDDEGPSLSDQTTRADAMWRRRLADRRFADAAVPAERRLRLPRVMPEAEWRHGSSLENPT